MTHGLGGDGGDDAPSNFENETLSALQTIHANQRRMLAMLENPNKARSYSDG